MVDPLFIPDPDGDHVEFLGDGDIIEVREEDTQPGKSDDPPSSPKKPPSGS